MWHYRHGGSIFVFVFLTLALMKLSSIFCVLARNVKQKCMCWNHCCFCFTTNCPPHLHFYFCNRFEILGMRYRYQAYTALLALLNGTILKVDYFVNFIKNPFLKKLME